MGTFIEKITIKKKVYIAKDFEDYPIDRFQYKRITRLRSQIRHMKAVIKDSRERIEVKTKFLEEIYDDILKKLEKYNKKHDRKRRDRMSD